MGVEVIEVRAQQFVDADRHQDAVDRLQRSLFAQQAEEMFPGPRVRRRIGILGGVAPGGVDQRGLVGEPEVEVTRAADALQRAVGEREAQAGVE